MPGSFSDAAVFLPGALPNLSGMKSTQVLTKRDFSTAALDYLKGPQKKT